MLQGDDAQALALEAGDDLAGQAACERVRLDQDEGPVHWGGLLRVYCGGASKDAVASGSSSSSSAPLERRRRLRLRGVGVTPGISASQYGQMRHDGSSGLAQFDARVLELAHAARAAQEVTLDLGVAVRAQEVVQRVQPRLGRLHLELALAHVLEVLGRADDHVDDGPHEREQRGRRRAGDEHRIGDAPARIGIRVVDERQPHDHEDEDQQLDGRVEAVVGDAEEA